MSKINLDLLKNEVIKYKNEIAKIDEEAKVIGEKFQKEQKKRDDISDKESAQYELQAGITEKILTELRQKNEKRNNLEEKIKSTISSVRDKLEKDKEKLARKALDRQKTIQVLEKDQKYFEELNARDKSFNIKEDDQIIQNRIKVIKERKEKIKTLKLDISSYIKEIDDINDKLQFVDYDNIENYQVKNNEGKKADDNTQTHNDNNEGKKADDNTQTHNDNNEGKKLDNNTQTHNDNNEGKKADNNTQTHNDNNEGKKADDNTQTHNDNNESIKTDNKEKQNAEKMGKQILDDMSRDYKNIHLEPEQMPESNTHENNSNKAFDEREPEKFYKENEEIPSEQLEGLERIGEDKPPIEDENIILSNIEQEENNKDPKENKIKKVINRMKEWIRKIYEKIRKITKVVKMLPEGIKEASKKAENESKDKVNDSDKQKDNKAKEIRSDTQQNNYSLKELLDNSTELNENVKIAIEYHALIHGEKSAKNKYSKELYDAEQKLNKENEKSEQKNGKTDFVERVNNSDGHMEAKAIEKVKGEVISEEEYKRVLNGNKAKYR